MENIDKEKQAQNLELFKKKLIECGVNTEALIEKYQNNLQEGTYAFSITNSVFCGDGTFLNVILRTLTPIAIKLNELLPQEKKVDNKVVIKTCLLHQISKTIMVTPNDNKWEIENRGILYKFKPSDCALKQGMRTIAMCMECGIQLTEQEIEAISNLDREEDKQMKFFSSPLSIILKQANEITDITGRK